MLDSLNWNRIIKIGIVVLLLIGLAMVVIDHMQNSLQVIAIELHDYELYQWRSHTDRVRVFEATGNVELELELTISNYSDREVVIIPASYSLVDSTGKEYDGQRVHPSYPLESIHFARIDPHESVYGLVGFELEDPMLPITLTIPPYLSEPVVIEIK